MNAADGWAPLLLLAAGICAALLLRQAWRRSSPFRPALTTAGWLAIVVVLIAALRLLGGARGLFAACIYLSIGALLVVAAGLQVRPARSANREGVLDPQPRRTNVWRAGARFLLAGPLGFIAASGAGIAYAVFTPGDMQTRIVLGGLLVPVAWAACMAWTLADDRLLCSTAVITAFACLTIGLSAWKHLL